MARTALAKTREEAFPAPSVPLLHRGICWLRTKRTFLLLSLYFADPWSGCGRTMKLVAEPEGAAGGRRDMLGVRCPLILGL